MVQYLIEEGLRKVQPYFFTHRTNCKGRWFGRTVADVFSTEFRDRSLDYYLREITNGNFKIFTRSHELFTGDTLLDYKIQNGDRLEYQQHQHEPVVPSESPKIIHQDENLVVVDKPSGIPVHPTQKYFYNSVSEILKYEHDFDDKIIPCHRLDKLTSGVLILGKGSLAAGRIQRMIQDKTSVEKRYLARVTGEFPVGEIVCNDPLVNIQTKKSFENGKPDPKPATTIFNRVSYDSVVNQSIVSCQPITGRTHQIRIHLRNLGHPILNDPLYGRGALLHNADADINEKEFEVLMEKANQNRDDLVSGLKCDICNAILYKDYQPENLVIWLHSFRYKVGEMVFETELPLWSKFTTV